MRTTLVIDDDILMAAKSIAATRVVSVGKALSELARKGLKTTARKRKRNGVPVFSVSRDAAPITPEQVKMLEDEF